MADELRIGIIGCGGIAHAHVNGYAAAGGNCLTAVSDPRPDAAAAMAETTGAAVAASAEEMLAIGVDAISVCSPPGAHFTCCEPFLRAGVPVLCEKPLGADVQQAAQLAALVAETDGLFMTAFCHRFHPPIIELKQLLASGRLGRPLLLRNIFGGYGDQTHNHRANPALSGGGPLIDHCCHSLDLLRFLFGEPTSVQAMGGNIMQDLAIEDFGMMHLDLGGKAFAEITGSYSLPVCDNVLECHGTEGMARVGYWTGGPDLSYRLKGGDWQVVDVSGKPDRFAGEIGHFLNCVRDGSRPAVTAADGLQANRIVAAAYESLHAGRRVDIVG